MADRTLPSRQNPKLDVIDNDPEKWQEFVDKRKLGKTDVPGPTGKKNKQLDYAYVKVPLPRDLQGSGIFGDRHSGSKGHYYLMRRSSDGYVSATGMFKLAFPWASLEEEEAEKNHLKTRDGVDPHEMAGNLWIPVPEALELADEYNLRNWLLVLLDPASMTDSVDAAGSSIKAPPTFKLTAKHRPKNKTEKLDTPITNTTTTTTTTTTTSSTKNESDLAQPTPSAARKRVTRSQSPEKGSASATPARKIATPSSRKPRGRPPAASKLASTAEEASEAETSDSVRPSTEADSSSKSNTKTAARKSTEQGSAPPASSDAANATPSPKKSLRQDAQNALDRANAAIKEATDLTLNRSAGKKRKARDVEAEDEAIDLALGNSNGTKEKDSAAGSASATQGSSKRIKVNELEFRKEKVLRRAGMGIAASLAVGLMVPILGGFLQSL